MDLTKPLKNYKNKVITLDSESNKLCIKINKLKHYGNPMYVVLTIFNADDCADSEEPYVTCTERVGFSETLNYTMFDKFLPETTLAEIRDWLIHQQQLKQIHSLSKEMNL